MPAKLQKSPPSVRPKTQPPRDPIRPKENTSPRSRTSPPKRIEPGVLNSPSPSKAASTSKISIFKTPAIIVRPEMDSAHRSSARLVVYTMDIHNLPLPMLDKVEERIQKQLFEKSEKCEALKRKASSISMESVQDSADLKILHALVDSKIELLNSQIEFADARMDVIVLENENGCLKREEFNQMQSTIRASLVLCWREKQFNQDLKEANFATAAVFDIMAQLKVAGDALSLALAAQHKGLDVLPEWLKRDWKLQAPFRRDLVNIYGAEDKNGRLWEPVLQKYVVPRDIRGAHLVPHLLGYDQVGLLFGEPDKGFEHVWSRRNGLLLSITIEEAFDRAQCCIIPTAKDAGRGNDWQFFVLDSSIRNKAVDHDLTFADLHGRELVFKDARVRPRRRYLYAHYVMAISRIQRNKVPGWAERYTGSVLGRNARVWATCGKYFRNSSLRVLARTITDDANAVRLFEAEDDTNSAVELTDEVAREIGIACVLRDEAILQDKQDNAGRERLARRKEIEQMEEMDLYNSFLEDS